MARHQRVLVVFASVCVALTAAACGGSSAPRSTTTTAKSVTTTTAKAITTPTVTINGRSYPVPTDGVSGPITPFSDSGQQVVLTPSGALPRELYSSLHEPVIFTNLTAHPLKLTVKNVGVTPSTIQPGGTYSYTPTVLAFSYAASNGAAGIVYVGAFQQQ
jgi:hypothetical protein